MRQEELHEKMQTMIDIVDSILIEAKTVGSNIEDPEDYFELMESAIKLRRAYDDLIDPILDVYRLLTKYGES